MDKLTIPQMFAVWTLPVLFAITIHEVAHGWVASLRGDQTARMMGRLTLNPLKHIDPIGTIIIPGILLVTSGFIFDWAKPVPVNFHNLKRPKLDMALVAVAGPLTNLLMALTWGGLLKTAIYLGQNGVQQALWLGFMSQAGIMINLVLMVLNLLPVPPLDGSRVAESLLPPKYGYLFRSMEAFGFIILLVLLYFGILGKIILPPVVAGQKFILTLFSII